MYPVNEFSANLLRLEQRMFPEKAENIDLN